jgi:hypothetical protein
VLFFPFGNQVEYTSIYLEHGYEDKPQPEDWYACVQFALVLWKPSDPTVFIPHCMQPLPPTNAGRAELIGLKSHTIGSIPRRVIGALRGLSNSASCLTIALTTGTNRLWKTTKFASPPTCDWLKIPRVFYGTASKSTYATVPLANLCLVTATHIQPQLQLQERDRHGRSTKPRRDLLPELSATIPLLHQCV